MDYRHDDYSRHERHASAFLEVFQLVPPIEIDGKVRQVPLGLGQQSLKPLNQGI